MRDIEVDGYHVRFERMLAEVNPTLTSINGETLARQRSYANADPAEVLAAFRTARKRTIELIASMTTEQLARAGQFEEDGRVTVQSLVHLLCSHDQQHLCPSCGARRAEETAAHLGKVLPRVDYRQWTLSLP